MFFDEALQYLLGLGHETLSIKLGLKNIERLLDALDSPQTSFPSVQIAGTNGKGSTAVMLSEIARAANITAGLYTSPHLSSITERIRIGNREISREEFARHATRVREAAEALLRAGRLQSSPTFFEQVTAIALLSFKEARVSLAILETGLGGRLDATTAAHAGVVAITPVSIDHQEYLGDTLTEIAAEKAAIIRAGVGAVVAPQSDDAMRVIMERCREVNVTPRTAGRGIEVLGASETGRFRGSFTTDKERYEGITLGLRGRHQLVNASVAIHLSEVLSALGFAISREAIREGIEAARHAGRLELWDSDPRVLFDGAHNRASAETLHDYLTEFARAPFTLLFGAMRDKELAEIASLLFPLAERLILTGMNNPRAATPEMLREVVPRDFDLNRVVLAESATDALRIALRFTPREGLLVVSGSLYLVGEAREILSNSNGLLPPRAPWA